MPEKQQTDIKKAVNEISSNGYKLAWSISEHLYSLQKNSAITQNDKTMKDETKKTPNKVPKEMPKKVPNKVPKEMPVKAPNKVPLEVPLITPEIAPLVEPKAKFNIKSTKNE